MSIRLSIIIPHYNSVDYLRELLTTIPPREEIEVIVVDDHSTIDYEKYDQLGEEFSHPNWFFLENQVNSKGAGTARNFGLKKAQGEYVLFADADDLFSPNVAAILDQTKLDTDIIFFPPTSFDMEGRVGKRHSLYEQLVLDFADNHNPRNELRLRCLYYSPCSKLLKRSFLINNGIVFDETYVSNDDMFSLKTGLTASTIRAERGVLYYIREHNSGLTHLKGKYSVLRKKVYCKWYKYIRDNVSREARREYLEFSARTDFYVLRLWLYVGAYELISRFVYFFQNVLDKGNTV